MLIIGDWGEEYLLVVDQDTNDDFIFEDYTVTRGAYGSTAKSHMMESLNQAKKVKARGNYMVLRETKPTFETVAYESSKKLENGNDKGIYRFEVGAEVEEDVSLGRLVFSVVGQFGEKQLGMDLDFIADADNPSNLNGMATDGTDGLGISPLNGLAPTVVLSGVKLYDMTDGEKVEDTTVYYANADDEETSHIIVDFSYPEEVGSVGKTYELRADLYGVNNVSDMLTVWIDNVNAERTKVTTNTLENVKDTILYEAYEGMMPYIQDDVVWSDQSNPSHSITTTDWTNGYLLKSLKTVAQTITPNGV